MKPLRRIHNGRLYLFSCRRCDEIVVYVDYVGWLDPVATHTYDICPGDPYGNHEAESDPIGGAGRAARGTSLSALPLAEPGTHAGLRRSGTRQTPEG